MTKEELIVETRVAWIDNRSKQIVHGIISIDPDTDKTYIECQDSTLLACVRWFDSPDTTHLQDLTLISANRLLDPMEYPQDFDFRAFYGMSVQDAENVYTEHTNEPAEFNEESKRIIRWVKSL